jgi:flagellar M-ring protein FliF
VLSEGPQQEGGEGFSGTHAEAERAIESHLESTLVAILEPVVGSGKVRARARVELNLTRVQRVQETYDPDGAVVRSEQKSKAHNTQAGSGGVPGTTSNLPGQNPVPAAGTAGGDESQTSTTNFEINKTVATITEPVGGLKRQSVAVLVDNVVVEKPGGNGTTEKTSTPRTEDEMRKITDLVHAAVGINDARGDTLIVENIPFEGAPAAATEALQADRADRWMLWVRIARYAALPIAVLLVIFFLVRPGLRAIRELRPVGALPAASGATPTVAELQARLALDNVPGQALAGEMRRRLIEAAKDDPEAAALVVRGWIEGAGGR